MLSELLNKPKKKKRKILELKLQTDFFKWIELQYPKLRGNCFHIPNEGKRSVIAGKILKDAGMTKGVSDVFCAIPSCRDIGMPFYKIVYGLFIEFKAPGEIDSVTKEQSEFISRMRDNGYQAIITDDLEEATREFKYHVQGYLMI